jgi:hypothetical protein
MSYKVHASHPRGLRLVISGLLLILFSPPLHPASDNPGTLATPC